MKKIQTIIYHFDSTEAKKISELAVICFHDTSCLDDKQKKVLNRLIAADRKWYVEEINEAQKIITVRFNDIEKTEADVRKEKKNATSDRAKDMASHILDNYEVLRRDLNDLSNMLLGTSPYNNAPEELEAELELANDTKK